MGAKSVSHAPAPSFLTQSSSADHARYSIHEFGWNIRWEGRGPTKDWRRLRACRGGL